MTPTFQDLMRDATRLTREGRLAEATALIQQALGGAGATPAARDARATGGAPYRHDADPSIVLDGCIVEVPDRGDPHVLPGPDHPIESDPGACVADRGARVTAGEFIAGTHTHASLTRAYKLYVPPRADDRRLPLVVMLHGCTQDPDDFATGTGMNGLAREQGVYVLYPGQASDANPQRCWNWFKHTHQARGRGEAAVIATMTQAVIDSHGIDPDRVYIAGMSAGGAMASVVAAAYPDVFAAVGVHSGLPPGAARSLPQALAAMRTGSVEADPRAGAQAGSPPRLNGMKPQPPAELPVPTIVFHGDRDPTVHPRNGEQVVAAVLRSRVGAALASEGRPVVEQDVSAGGRRFTRAIHTSDSGRPVVEHWMVHGAGHAWSGGQPGGSYTDAQGPDASREMLRFFLQHTRRPAG